MTFTVKPVVVGTGVENVGVSAVPNAAVLVNVDLPVVYPVRLAVAEIIALCPGFNPEMVIGSVAPDALPLLSRSVDTDNENVNEAL